MTRSTSKHILAGDNSPDILDLFREIFEAEGYRVSLSSDALNLDQVKHVGPDLVILDHMLEDGDGSGWRLVEDLRRDPDTVSLPVIVCTGAVHRIRENESALHRLGVGVVLKPFDIDDLLTTVNRFWGDVGVTADTGGVAAPAAG